MHAMRMSFQLLGATIPNPSQLGAQFIPISQAIRVDGLIQKTVEVRADASELAANPIIVQGSITAIGPSNKPEAWFNLMQIYQVGIYPLVVPDQAGASSHEPSLNAIRLLATENIQAGTMIFPPTLIASFSGLWIGPGVWTSRHIPYGA